MGAGKSREIKDRIKGVKSTHQITNAMNIVSSTKFKRFSALVEKSRPYAESLHGVLKNIAAGLKSEKHPLLDGKKTVKKIGIDATKTWPEEGHTREWPDEINMSDDIKKLVDAKWQELGLE